MPLHIDKYLILRYSKIKMPAQSTKFWKLIGAKGVKWKVSDARMLSQSLTRFPYHDLILRLKFSQCQSLNGMDVIGWMNIDNTNHLGSQ